MFASPITRRDGRPLPDDTSLASQPGASKATDRFRNTQVPGFCPARILSHGFRAVVARLAQPARPMTSHMKPTPRIVQRKVRRLGWRAWASGRMSEVAR